MSNTPNTESAAPAAVAEPVSAAAETNPAAGLDGASLDGASLDGAASFADAETREILNLLGDSDGAGSCCGGSCCTV